MRSFGFRFTLLAVLAVMNTAHAAVLTVGTGLMYEKPSMAFAASKDGDTIRIYKGIYVDDFAVIRRNRVTIEGVDGRPLITQSAGAIIPNGKALWVIDGNNVIIKNIEFSNAHCDNNCEGIRAEAADTIILHSSFHNNEFGLLSAALPNVTLDIENSEFYDNGGTHSLCHQIYVAGKSLIFKFNYVHHAPCDGHLLKTRAQYNYIMYNRITAEAGDQSSYQLDIPVGGETYIIGNILEKSKTSNNPALIAYDEEGVRRVNSPNQNQILYIMSNTMVNKRESGIFILQANDSAGTEIGNNFFIGAGDPVIGASLAGGNVITQAPGVADSTKFDYRLTSSSPAIGKAIKVGKSRTGVALIPSMEYRHPVSSEPRRGSSDAGAYEHAVGP